MKQNDRIININSWIVALLICSTCIAVVIPSQGVVVLTNILLFGIIIVLNIRHYSIRKYAPSIVLTTLLLVLFMINILINNQPQVTEFMLHFICFGIPLLFIPIQNVDFEKVIRNIAVAAIFFLPFFLMHDYGYTAKGGDDGSDDGDLMTASYRVLPLILSAFLSSMKECRKIWMWGVISLGIIYLAFLMVIGSRGAILSVMVFFVLLLISRSKSKTGKISLSGIIVALAMILITQFDKVIEWLYDKTEAFGLSLLALSRLYYKTTQGDNMDSGRGDLIAEALRDFIDSPIWGNGIASFQNFTNYPHNLFVQMLQEGGLILFVPFAIIFLIGLKNLILGDRNSTYYRVLLFTFCGGVMQLMFSNYFWTSSLFWLFVMLVLYRRSIRSMIRI